MDRDTLIALRDVIREADRPRKKPKTKLLMVGAFLIINGRGKPTHASPVEVGDELYMARTEQPGAGMITKDSTGNLIGIAKQAIAAGAVRAIKAATFQKRWITDNDDRVCELCDENELVGWIDADEDFPNGNHPPTHVNCRCEIEIHRGE